MVSGIKSLAADILGPISCEVGPQYISFVQHILQILNQTVICLEARSILGLFVMICVNLKLFLNNICKMAGYIILLKEVHAYKE